MLVQKKPGIAFLLATAAALVACGGGGGGGSSSTTTTSSTSSTSSSTAASSASTSSNASSSATLVGSLGATGWATYGTGTTGGNSATAAKTYTVSTRVQLIQALYGNSATINADGSIASGSLDSSAKIIYVSGEISLNTNKAGTELTEADYICPIGTSFSYSGSSGSVTTSTTVLYSFDAYKTQYDPNGSWGTTAVEKSGDPYEVARACSAANQKKIVYLSVPSNTSIIGLGSNAKIVHGSLVVGASSSTTVDNVVIRNIAFEDAFDFFPIWDPTDSGGRWNSAYDLVSVMYATHVWIDHNTFSDGSRHDKLYPSPFASPYNAAEMKIQHHDGALDITKTANYVTASWNHFHDHDKTNLIGGTDTVSTSNAASAENPTALKITFHHNYWQNIKQRQPRVRYGMVHIFNNYFENTLDSTADYYWSAGMVTGQGGKLYMENNVFALSGGSPSASTVYSGASDSTKATTCATTMNKTVTAYTPVATYDANFCSAYAYGTGNVLNGSTIDLSAVSATGVVTWTTTPWFASGKTTGTPDATPSSYYSYTSVLEATSNLATTIPAGAGAGKL
ncbi:polysaccharide lyase family 1 protein [Uliginosibacterium sp. TH139]|uniref:pectate lyase family protein n=1 Tax=Uliginosibacterium sp. TH139 TaxID=2067453 RepID=UPI000C7E5404|nr:polysaccharide lyase family 1 protein [Uliginosibacterium sp. TH139]PLK49999.1 pectate lyase [Uliginosibacterium sp. TH139]